MFLKLPAMLLNLDTVARIVVVPDGVLVVWNGGGQTQYRGADAAALAKFVAAPDKALAVADLTVPVKP